MTGPERGEYRVPPPPKPSRSGKVDGGISGNKMMKILGTGKRQLMRIRDDPEELRQFCLDRTGQAYEYRDGKYWAVD